MQGCLSRMKISFCIFTAEINKRNKSTLTNILIKTNNNILIFRNYQVLINISDDKINLDLCDSSLFYMRTPFGQAKSLGNPKCTDKTSLLHNPNIFLDASHPPPPPNENSKTLNLLEPYNEPHLSIPH